MVPAKQQDLHRQLVQMRRTCWKGGLSYDEINKAVQELTLNKSPGEDTIPNEILKLKGTKISVFLIFDMVVNN